MLQPDHLPVEMPAVGGWYWDEKLERPIFLMPPYPGVDDCIQTEDGLWAYRALFDRDKDREVEIDNP